MNRLDSGGAVRSSPRPRVTIGVPVFNGEKYLGKCLDSLVTQTYQDIEILICDNASTDGTAGICRSYAARDPRIRYVRNPENIGLGGNFRKVLELAEGEYFKAAAADDWCAPEFVEHCVAALDREPSAVLAYPLSRIVDDSGEGYDESHDGIDGNSELPSERFIQLLENIRLCNALYGVARTSVVRRTKWVADYRSADSVFLAELTLYGKLREVPEVLFFRRFHTGDTTRMNQAGKIDQYLKPAGSKTIGMVCVTWRRLLAFVFAVFRAPIALNEKAKLAWWLCRDSVWKRKELGSELLAALRLILRKS
jgi:glycosyltransferase involved in cell wall biosynthesis